MSHEHTLKDLIEAALRSYSFNESITRGRVEQAYREVVGEFIVKLTRSVRYDVGSHTLRVVLSAAALKNEISYKTSDLVAAINKKLGSNEVEKIQLL